MGEEGCCILPKTVYAPFQISNDDHPKYKRESYPLHPGRWFISSLGKYSITPLIWINQVCKPSGYAETTDNWIFCLKIDYIASLKFGCYHLQYVPAYKGGPEDSSVGIATRYGLHGPGIDSRCGRIFRTRPDRPWGLPSLLYNGYRVFLGGKAAGAWR